MIEPGRFVDALAGYGVRLFTGVPDSLLAAFCSHVMATLPPERHIIAANEGAAVGIAIGHYLRGGTPALVYMQNSGFGNAVNPLLSLADPDVYGIPMLLLVGWRGQPGVKDEPQHVKQGHIMTDLLQAMALPWAVLPKDWDAAEAAVAEAYRVASDQSRPYVLLVEKDSFSPAGSSPAQPAQSHAPTREDALVALAEAIGDDAIQVSTTGMLSRELFEHRRRTRSKAGRDFLTVGGMGHASAIALGIALEEPRREVWCLDGDGALLMHLGGLPVIARNAPATFFLVVFNNGVHDSVGGQPTAIDVVDIPQLARAAGYRVAGRAEALADIAHVVAHLRQHGGPALLELRVRPGHRKDLGRPTVTPQDAKAEFMAALR